MPRPLCADGAITGTAGEHPRTRGTVWKDAGGWLSARPEAVGGFLARLDRPPSPPTAPGPLLAHPAPELGNSGGTG